MKKLKDIIGRSISDKGLRQQFFRFLRVGVTNTVGTYLLYLILILVIPYVLAYSITFAVGVLFSAWLNARYSFATRLTGRTLFRFVIIYVINFVLSMQFLILCVEVFGIHAALAPLLVLAVFTPLNFLSSKYALTGQWRHQV